LVGCRVHIAPKAIDADDGKTIAAGTAPAPWNRAIGHTLWLKGDLRGAVAGFQTAPSLDDTGDYAHWGLGAVLYRPADKAGGVTHLQRAADLQPDEAQHHSWLGACLVNLKPYQEARDFLNKLKAAGY